MPPHSDAGPVAGPPDGGWGWVVVFGAFISIGFAYAFPKGIAIFYKEIQDFFDTSYSEIAWVSSIMLATTYGAGEYACLSCWVCLRQISVRYLRSRAARRESTSTYLCCLISRFIF